MHEAALARAAIPEPTRILRLPLKPYSLGHELALFIRSNPFVTHSQADFQKLKDTEKNAALLQAILVCSSSWFENQRKRKNLRIWNFIRRFCDHELAFAQFENYKAQGRLEFKADFPSNSDCKIRFIGAPQALRLYQFVVKNVPAFEILRYGASVWDFPYSLAMMMMQAQAEEEGNLEIYNHRQKFHDDYVAEMEEKRIAEEKEKEYKCQVSLRS